jgi:hypothetical protein
MVHFKEIDGKQHCFIEHGSVDLAILAQFDPNTGTGTIAIKNHKFTDKVGEETEALNLTLDELKPEVVIHYPFDSVSSIDVLVEKLQQLKAVMSVPSVEVPEGWKPIPELVPITREGCNIGQRVTVKFENPKETVAGHIVHVYDTETAFYIDVDFLDGLCDRFGEDDLKNIFISKQGKKL